MELKSKSVRLFCAVVESGSLLAAADKIALSASAASRNLKNGSGLRFLIDQARH